MILPMSKSILFSGIQPSGQLHIGAYAGAIKQWVELQDQYEGIYCIVDLHAITVTQDPKILHERCYDLLTQYIACGLDPDKNILFIQSHVPAHAELAWILNCFTYVGELNRMTQFKDKSKQHSKNVNVGLYDYPVLMASDILLYNTNIVPVGDDQKQHLELTREIAIRFNNRFGDIFIVPEPYIPKHNSKRIMGLQTPENKMSKSDINQNNSVYLLDSPEIVRKKFKRAVTDSDSEVRFDESKAGISNLLIIYSAITNQSIQELEKQYRGKGYGDFKKDIGEAMVPFLAPIQEKYHSLRKDKKTLDKIFQKGAERAHTRSQIMIKKVYDALGFIKRTYG